MFGEHTFLQPNAGKGKPVFPRGSASMGESHAAEGGRLDPPVRLGQVAVIGHTGTASVPGSEAGKNSLSNTSAVIVAYSMKS